MKLKDKDFQEAKNGLPASHREWWDLGNGYEVYVDLSKDACLMGISQKGKGNITLEVARFLGIDTKIEDISFKRPKDGSDLFLVLGIDCIGIESTQPENYKELLKKIELIINKNFNNRAGN